MSRHMPKFGACTVSMMRWAWFLQQTLLLLDMSWDYMRTLSLEVGAFLAFHETEGRLRLRYCKN